MPECKYINTCPFFHNKMANMPNLADLYKKNYCKEDNSKCARLIVLKAVGRNKIPPDLFPNQIKRAEDIVNS